MVSVCGACCRCFYAGRHLRTIRRLGGLGRFMVPILKARADDPFHLATQRQRASVQAKKRKSIREMRSMLARAKDGHAWCMLVLVTSLFGLSPGTEAFITKGNKTSRTAAQYPGRSLPGLLSCSGWLKTQTLRLFRVVDAGRSCVLCEELVGCRACRETKEEDALHDRHDWRDHSRHRLRACCLRLACIADLPRQRIRCRVSDNVGCCEVLLSS